MRNLLTSQTLWRPCRGQDGLAMVLGLMAVATVVGAGFVGYLDNLSRGTNYDYETIFFEGTISAVRSNVHTILVNSNSLAFTGAGNASMAMACLATNTCNSYGTPNTFPWSAPYNTGINLYTKSGTLYYNFTSGTDGFMATGYPCNLASVFWQSPVLTNSVGICLMQPVIYWAPNCAAGNGCGNTTGPANYAQSYVAMQIPLAGLPSNFYQDAGANKSMGYPIYLGQDDTPINSSVSVLPASVTTLNTLTFKFGF